MTMSPQRGDHHVGLPQILPMESDDQRPNAVPAQVSIPLFFVPAQPATRSRSVQFPAAEYPSHRLRATFSLRSFKSSPPVPSIVRPVGEMPERLGAVCREARLAHQLRLIDIATIAGVSEATISNFEAGQGWRRQTDDIVIAYERECGLPPGELWRRAIG